MIILVLIPVGGFTPPLQDPHNLVGMVLMGPKFCPQFSFMTKENKLTLLQNLSQTVEVYPKSGHFGVNTGGGFAPPRTPKI